MARIEKTVFISYRRTDVYTALAVYENLKNQGYDVFFDYRSISSGDFEQIIISNIRARAHFLLILTSTALDRCDEPGDWLRREIEIAIDEKRNVVPLFFKGFRFGAPSVTEKLTGKLKNLSRYNGLNVHEDYFDEAMQRLSVQYLNIPLDTVLHPVSTLVQKVVREEQVAADRALEQIEDVQELVKYDEKPVQFDEPDPISVLEASVPVETQTEKQTGIPVAPVVDTPTQRDEIPKEKVADIKPVLNKAKTKPAFPFRLSTKKITLPKLNYRLFGGIAAGVFFVAISILGIPSLFRNQPINTPDPTQTSQPVFTRTPEPVATGTKSATATSVPPQPTLSIIKSTVSKNDGMKLVYVPSGEFTMEDDGQTMNLAAFWIDQTEVTNGKYSLCVNAGVCKEPAKSTSYSRSSYFGNSQYSNYPVIYVNWENANIYCEWAGRRLPTRFEWWKAALGIDGNRYPWGNDLRNSNFLNFNNIMGDTTEAGIYLTGSSPYGALDMAGNVSEWISDLFTARGGTILGYALGGSWNSNEPFYSALAMTFSPTVTSFNIGFRCVQSE